MNDESLPDGWRLASLAELGEVNRGRSRHRPRYADHLYGGPYPFIQTGDIRTSDGRITSHSTTYSEAGLAQSRLWPAGTMCITIAANIAETAILTYAACFPDSVVGFIADSTRADVHFVEYAFRLLKRRLQQEAMGSVQDNINLEVLSRLRLPIPLLSEQHAIAAVLGSLDDKIEQNRRTGAKLEELARAVFKAWFVVFEPVKAKAAGQTNYPGITSEAFAALPDRFVDSEIGPVPEGWAVNKLPQLATFLNGLAMQKYPSRGDRSDIPVIKIAELRKESTANADLANADVPGQYIITDGDLLFSWSGTLEVKRWFGGKGALNQHIFKVTPSRHPLWFMHHAILQHLPEFRAIASSKATTMGHIQRKHLDAALIAVPPEAIFRNIDEQVSPIYALAGNLKSESRLLTSLRDYLLPKLLSGKILVRPGDGTHEI